MRGFSVVGSSLGIQDSIVLGLFFIAILMYGGASVWLLRKGSNKWQQIAINVSRVTLAMAAVALQPITRSITSGLERAFEWMMEKLGLQLTQILIAAGILAIGIGAHKFKQRNKKWYGSVEVIVGFVSAVVVAKSLGPNTLDLAKWSTLAGCAYVIARGLGNRAEARKETMEESLAVSTLPQGG